MCTRDRETARDGLDQDLGRRPHMGDPCRGSRMQIYPDALHKSMRNPILLIQISEYTRIGVPFLEIRRFRLYIQLIDLIHVLSIRRRGYHLQNAQYLSITYCPL